MQNQSLKLTLLKRFYLLVIVINSMAFIIDLYLKKYTNFTIEIATVLALAASFYYLKISKNILNGAYFFLIIIAITLFALIYVNHFATLSIFFAPLLPLVVLLFLGVRKTLYIMLIHVIFFGVLLYIEWHINPQNPIFNNKNVLFSLGYALIIIYLFGIFYHLFIMKTFEDLENVNKKNSLLLGEIHHRVKNNLNVIASILGLQITSLSQKEKIPLLQTKTRIEAMGMVHEMLYQKDKKELVDVDKYLQQLSQLLFNLYQKKSLHVNIQTNSIELPLQLMFQLGIIANELFTNSLKHGFVIDTGSIQISLEKKEKKYIFFYEDDGKGVEDLKKLQESKTLGYKLIKLAVKQLHGQISIKNKPHLAYTIKFPYV